MTRSSGAATEIVPSEPHLDSLRQGFLLEGGEGEADLESDLRLLMHEQENLALLGKLQEVGDPRTNRTLCQGFEDLGIGESLKDSFAWPLGHEPGSSCGHGPSSAGPARRRGGGLRFREEANRASRRTGPSAPRPPGWPSRHQARLGGVPLAPALQRLATPPPCGARLPGFPESWIDASSSPQ